MARCSSPRCSRPRSRCKASASRRRARWPSCGRATWRPFWNRGQDYCLGEAATLRPAGHYRDSFGYPIHDLFHSSAIAISGDGWASRVTRVERSGPTRVVLVPGTELVLVAPFGSPNGTVEWSVVDQDGVDCWQVGAFERGMRSYECGPVPPGTYRVRCTLSGRTAEGVVRVDGEPQVRVDLGP